MERLTHLAHVLPFKTRLTLAFCWVVGSCIWLYVFKPVRSGAPRAAAAALVLVGNCALPLLFEPRLELLSVFFLEFSLTWMSNFKVLAWVLGRGPLCHPWTFAQFAAILVAPITPVTPAPGAAAKARTPSRTGSFPPIADSPTRLLLQFLGKLALVGAGLAALQYDLPEAVVEYLYSLGLYAILSLAMDGPAALITALLGFQVAPHFCEPWRSCSLGEFWARRWDLVAGNSLRHLVYDPILEGRLVPEAAVAGGQKGKVAATAARAQTRARSRWRRLVGMAACFAASAAMHEVQFWYFVRRWSGGRYGGFFLAQIPAMAVERWLGAVLRRRGLAAPAVLRAAATQLLLLAAGHLLFWPPLKEAGVVQGAVEGVRGNAVVVGRALGVLG